MRKSRLTSIVVFSLVMSMMFSSVCFATPTKTNQNKNSNRFQKNHATAYETKVTTNTPKNVDPDEDVSKELVDEAKDKDKEEENKNDPALAKNEVKYTTISSQYKNIPILHLPYDEYMRINAKWFYETGMYDRQGVNSVDYKGTSSEAAAATVMNRLFKTNVYTENNMLLIAGMFNLCTMGQDPALAGGQSAEQLVQMLKQMTTVTGDAVDANYLTNGFVPSVKKTAELLENGSQLIISVASAELWDYSKNDSAIANFYDPNHWIVVTAPKYDDEDNIEGFYIVDSSGSEKTYLPLEKYKACVWGPTGKEITNQVCVIVRKAGTKDKEDDNN